MKPGKPRWSKAKVRAQPEKAAGPQQVADCLPLKNAPFGTSSRTVSPVAWAALGTTAQLGLRASPVRTWSPEENRSWGPHSVVLPRPLLGHWRSEERHVGKEYGMCR